MAWLRLPARRTAKIGRNKARDPTTGTALRTAGWRTLIAWECQLKVPKRVAARLRRFLA